MANTINVEGHQGKFKNSKGALRQTMHLLSFDKLQVERKGAGLVCPPPLGTVY